MNEWLKGCGRGSPQRAAAFSFLCGHFLLQAKKGGICFVSSWMNLDLPQLAAHGRSDVGPVDLAIKKPTLCLVKASHHNRNFTTLRTPCSDTAQSSLMERPWGRALRHQICEWRCVNSWMQLSEWYQQMSRGAKELSGWMCSNFWPTELWKMTNSF